jgi:long-chain fatty acid transport protein
MRPRSLVRAVVVASLAVAGTAHAGGYATARFGAADGNVTSTRVWAAYYNPAGLAFESGWRISLEGTIGYRTASYDRDPAAIDNVIPTGETGLGTPAEDVEVNSGKNTLSNLVTSPFFGAATDFGIPNLGVALTFSVPFGGQAEWGQDGAVPDAEKYPGAIDGSQRWHAISGTIRSMYITAAGAYYIPAAKLSFGVGLNLVLSDVDTIRARTPSGHDDVVSEQGGGAYAVTEGRSLLTADGVQFSLGAGLMWVPLPELRVGLSYQSQPNFGTFRLKGTLTNKYGAGAAGAGPIELEQALPDILRVGAAYAVNDDLEVHAQFGWERWSVLEYQCVLDATMPDRNCSVDADGAPAGAVGIVSNVPRYWHDSFDFRVGGAYRLTPKVLLDGGFAVNTSAIPDRTLDAGFIDMLKFLPTIGGRFTLTDNFVLAAHWTQVIYLARTAGVEEPFMAPTTVPSGAGKYTQSVGILQVEAQVLF